MVKKIRGKKGQYTTEFLTLTAAVAIAAAGVLALMADWTNGKMKQIEDETQNMPWPGTKS